MSLDTDQMNQLMYDAMSGKDAPSIPGDDALAFFTAVKKDADELKAKGIMPMPVKS
jgi:hypothetical protein